MKKNVKPRTARTEEELKVAIKESFRHLLKSIKDFDAGDLSEGKRIGSELRKILNNHPPTHVSALSHAKGLQWRFYDAAHAFDPENLLTTHALAGIRFQSNEDFEKVSFVPKLEEPKNKRILFCDWWSKNTILTDQKRNRFTRMDIVLWVGNQDGHHIDEFLTDEYKGFITGSSHGWIAKLEELENPIEKILETSLRTMAHETILTFKHYRPDLVPNDVCEMYS